MSLRNPDVQATCLTFALAVLMALPAAQAVPPPPATAPSAPAAGASASGEASAPATVITSRRFTYETAKHEAVFEDKVVVRDARLALNADRLVVRFNAQEQVEQILATGTQVLVQQDERKAGGRSLQYDLTSGKMVLKDKAWVQQGPNMLRGDTITLWRDEERVQAEPNVEFTVRLGAGAAGSAVPVFPGRKP